MIRLILTLLFIILFLLLSIPILIIEWLIGKKNRYAADISQLRIVQRAFRGILFLCGTHHRHRRRTCSKRHRRTLRRQSPKLFRHRHYLCQMPGTDRICRKRFHVKSSSALALDETPLLPVFKPRQRQRRIKNNPDRNQPDQVRYFHVHFPGRHAPTGRRRNRPASL